MKEYNYKINGTEYTVAIGDIDDNTVDVKVNGVSYSVELEKTEMHPTQSWLYFLSVVMIVPFFRNIKTIFNLIYLPR